MWYKADSAGNTNALWNDASGYGYNLSQGTVSKQPVLTQNTLNFNPAYVFDGTDDVMSMPNHGIGGSDPLTAFFSGMLNTNAGGWRYLNEFGDDTPSVGFNNGKPELYARGTSPISLTYPTEAVNNPHVFSYMSPNASGQSRIVGVDNNEQSQTVTAGTYTTNSGSQSGTSFGGTNGSAGTSFSGPVGEAVYFNKVLTQPERQRLNSYLSIKWGATLDQGSSGTAYLASDSSTVWSADSTYKNRIVGIGRDDTSTLNQKQSKGGNDVTLGRGTIAANNAANSNTFANDKSFLLWGDNGADATQTTVVTGAYKRVNRIWKAVSTNTPGQVKMSVPKTLVDAAGADGILFTSSSTTFDASSPRTTMTLNGANYEATVTLGAGTSYFTFGALAGSDIQFVSKAATDIGGTPITSYTPGEAIEYKLTVKNNGPDNAGTVTVTDTLPAGVVPVNGGATGGGWSCNVSGQTVTCTRPALNTGVTAPAITVEATIASSITGTKNNTATASVSNDPDVSNNSASLNLPAAPKADLSITKAHTGTPTAGGSYTYNFVVTNNGPSDISSFTVADTLDSNLTYASASGASCSAAGQVVTCTGGALTASGGSSTASFSVTVNVSSGYPGGAISNTGTVSPPAGTTDPNSANNSSVDDTNVIVSTNLSITKTHTGNFTAGTNGAFTLTVANAGPSNTTANGVTVTDTLDADFSYVSAIGTNWSCSNSGDTVTCNYSGVIAAGGSAPAITLTVHVDPIAKNTVANTAEESSTTPDPTGDSTATDNVTINSIADLALTKAHVGTAFTAGAQEQYTFTATNNGPSSDAPSYTITDTLPAGVTFVGTEAGSAATCSAAGQVVTCNGGAIAASGPAQTTTINVAISGSATGTINNSATIAPTAGTTDNVSGNNTGNDSVAIEPNADLSIVKTHTGNVMAGANVTYSMVVSNAGPSNVSSFTLTDVLDQNYAYQSATGATCTPSGQTINCTGGAINSGSQTTVTITAALESSATAGGTISNTATVAAPTGVNDSNTSNNSSTVANTIDASADLAITKTHTGNFKAGSNGTFTIQATNNGPSDADTATITDVLPTGFTYVSTTSSLATCTNAGQTVTCAIGPTVSSGQTVTVTLVVAVDPAFSGTSLNNTATIASSTSDPNMANNSSTNTVNFDQAQANLNATKAATGPLTAGEPVTYRFTVTNNGPDNAGAVKIDDTLPSYLTYQSFTSISGGSWNCSNSGQAVSCTLGTLNNGGTAVVDVTVLVDQNAPNPAVNAATVTFNGQDTSANTPSTSNPVSYSADLGVSITREQKTYQSGDKVSYTYVVTNHGPSTAKDAVLDDTISEGLTIDSVSADSPGGSSILSVLDHMLFARATAASNPFTCSMSGQHLTCNASTLLVGTYKLYVVGTINNSFTGSITNSAHIASATPDPNTSDTTATDVISGVLAAKGTLPGTGQNILLWLGSALTIITIGAGIVAVRIRRARF